MEPLISLVYTSKSTNKINLSTLREILKNSQSLNSKNQITGFLSVRDGVFLQMLEGPKSKVMACFERIKLDQRHTQIILQGVCDIDQRILPDWSMGIIDSKSPEKASDILALFDLGRAGMVYKEHKSLLSLLSIFTRGATIKIEPDFINDLD